MYNVLKSPMIDFLDPESENYDESKVIKEGPFFMHEKKVYIPCRLELLKRDSTDFLSWLLWAYLDAKDFVKFSESPNQYKGLLKAKLFHPILFYNNTKDLKVTLDFKLRDENFMPTVVLDQKNTNEELFYAFERGMDEEEFNSIMNKIN